MSETPRPPPTFLASPENKRPTRNVGHLRDRHPPTLDYCNHGPKPGVYTIHIYIGGVCGTLNSKDPIYGPYTSSYFVESPRKQPLRPLELWRSQTQGWSGSGGDGFTCGACSFVEMGGGWGLGFRVQGLGFKVYRVQGLQGFGFTGFRV